MATISDYSLASFIAGNFTLLSIALTYYFKNRRAMRKVSAEDFIENFMKRQEQDIEHKNNLIREMEQTLKKQEATIRDLEKSNDKKELTLQRLKGLVKELRNEISLVKKQANDWQLQLEQMKKDYNNLKT